MSSLSDFLAKDAIALDVEVDDWEGAVRRAGALLEDTGVADRAYTTAMVESVQEKGPYIVVAPGFAFAHARPSDAVHRTGMSWLRLSRPVEFGHASNDPVGLVVALAAKDTKAHQTSMAQLAKVLADPDKKAALQDASTPEDLLAVLDSASAPATAREAPGPAGKKASPGSTNNHILTVCGNGVGTSLFLKSTVEKVLGQWGWSRYVSVEATDTVSAKGKAKEADLILTSGEIGRALGDLGVPMQIIKDFTSVKEVDAALRDSYDV